MTNLKLMKRNLARQTKRAKEREAQASEPKRMAFGTYLYLKSLLQAEQEKLHKEFQRACDYIPSEYVRDGKSGRDKAYDIFTEAYHKMTVMMEELHDAAACTYKDHPNPEMRKFWGLKV